MVISDKKNGIDTDSDGKANYYVADIRAFTDYDPFGMPLPGRTFQSANGYRYSYNGKENDQELQWLDYGFRMYDYRIGRFPSVDPLTATYPELTPYQYASNSPIALIDIDGLEGFWPTLFRYTPLLQSNKVVPRVPTEVVENVVKTGNETGKRPSKFSPETLENFRRGNQTEAEQIAKNGLKKNNKSIEVELENGENVVTKPDAFKNGEKSTVEIKNVKQQSLTKQLKAQEKFSNENGFKPELIINKGAKISQPLKNSTFDIKYYTPPPTTMPSDNTKLETKPYLSPGYVPPITETCPDCI